MANISKLEGLKRKAQKDGWARFIRTPLDEEALLKGFTFSWDRYDHFRFFVDNFCKLTKDRWNGQPLKLLPFHDIICGSILGWVDDENLRRFQHGYIEVPKKNSKTTIFAVLGNYLLVSNDGGPEIYTCANEKEQAAILWNTAADMIEASEELSSIITVNRSVKRMRTDNKSWFAAWSSDVSGKDGPNALAILVDELHEWKGNRAREFWKKIRYAGAARQEPLIPLVITTAGDDRNSLCWEERMKAEAVLNGVSVDLRHFACIYAANPEKIKNDPDYWKKEECWREANPAFGYILTKEQFEADILAVENDPTAKAAFLRYRLGVWIDSGSPWLKSGVWKANEGDPFTEEDLIGEAAYMGVDLSSVHDFTATSLVFPYINERNEKKFRAIWRYFVPEDTFGERVRKDSTGSLRRWYEEGFIQTTPGNAIEHKSIYNSIRDDCDKFQVKQLAYDRNSAAWIIQEIQATIPGVELFPFNQSMIGMSAPTKALTASLLSRKIEHGGNPVSAWMASNAVVEENNAQNNMMLHKGKSKEKIDGIVAFLMAYAQAELGSVSMKPKFSPYSDSGFKAIKEIEGISDNKK